MGISPMAPIIAETVGAHAPLLTPVDTPVKVGPGGCKFSDYWKYGLPIGYGGWSSTPS